MQCSYADKLNCSKLNNVHGRIRDKWAEVISRDDVRQTDGQRSA